MSASIQQGWLVAHAAAAQNGAWSSSLAAHGWSGGVALAALTMMQQQLPADSSWQQDGAVEQLDSGQD